MKTCPNCNSQMNDDAMFCGNCGTQFTASQSGCQQPQQNGYGYQQPYQQPYGQKPDDGKGFSVAALVLGICGVCVPYAGVLAILGIVFGVIGRAKSVECYGKASGMATAGLVLGIVGTAFAFLWIGCICACTTGCGSCTRGITNPYYWY